MTSFMEFKKSVVINKLTPLARSLKCKETARQNMMRQTCVYCLKHDNCCDLHPVAMETNDLYYFKTELFHYLTGIKGSKMLQRLAPDKMGDNFMTITHTPVSVS